MAPLRWLPGESLFSLCSRYHHIAGHRTPAQTCRVLFGSHRPGSAHDVPAHVQDLVERTHGELGSTREIILARTLLPYYFPFHPEHVCENWLIQLSTGTASSLKAQLGLAASQFGASHPLKACQACIESDTQDHGVAYWHVEHQVPAVFICPWHRNPLLCATDKVSGQDRFGWVLPAQARLKSLLVNSYTPDFDQLLADCALALWGMQLSFTFSLDRVSRIYRSKLVEQGFVHPFSARVDHKRFDQSLHNVLSGSSITVFCPWLALPDNVRVFSRRLLRMGHPSSPRWSRHPLNHLTLLVLLFGSWKAFWDAYQQLVVEEPGSDSVGYPKSSPQKDEAIAPQQSLRATLIEHIQSGASVSRAAELAGVSVSTAMTWAAHAGIHSPRRPKVLKAPARARLISQLKRGVGKILAASSVNISVVTVTRVLMTEPGLHDQWQSARFNQAQIRARDSWLAIRDAFPESSSNEWRSMEPSAYAWLYRNDRPWLQRSIRERPRPATTSPQRRDWQKRDAALAQAVRVAALDWQLSHPGKRLTIGEICATVVGLRQKFSALHKLPLARQAIRDACASSRRPASSAPLLKGLFSNNSGL